jgi:hypothetical protein
MVDTHENSRQDIFHSREKAIVTPSRVHVVCLMLVASDNVICTIS